MCKDKGIKEISTLTNGSKLELEYFKNSSPEARNILKSYIPGYDIGLLAGLLTALYDEDQLQAYKTFTNMKE